MTATKTIVYWSDSIDSISEGAPVLFESEAQVTLDEAIDSALAATKVRTSPYFRYLLIAPSTVSVDYGSWSKFFIVVGAKS